MTDPRANEAKKIIKLHGGSTVLAKKLNYNVQRVQNWKKRGIPPGEKLKFPELFLNIDTNGSKSNTNNKEKILDAKKV